MKNRIPPSRTLWASLLACSIGIAACGTKAEEAAGESPAVVASPPRTVPELFQANCAPCHGVKGDGEGIVKLDRPARSFLQGAFSFGNTPEALLRTITNGIGGTPMPGFKEALTEQQRIQLAAYVIELGPEQVAVIPGASEMRVSDHPLVVRGGLPPIADGLSPVTRGLLVGGVDGLTFEYNAKPLVLLGVRQGGFVDRKDWQDRGGSELQPLGVLTNLVDGGNAIHMWEDADGRPLVAKLIATDVGSDGAWVEYGLVHEDSQSTEETIVLRESGDAITVAGWPGYRRTFATTATTAFQNLNLVLLQEDKVTELAEGSRGRLFLLKDPESSATIVVKSEMTLRSFGGGGVEHRLFLDTLSGLQPTEENLKGLKELVQ